METKTLHYEIGKIDEAKAEGIFYQIKFDNNSVVFLKKKYGIVPKAGDTIEVYGEMGHTIQGMCINGKTAFFNGEIGLKIDHKKYCRNMDSRRKREFKKSIDTLDAKYNSLPDVFKKRLDILRRNNPKFRWKFEPYEMMCCVDAVKIAAICGTKEKVIEFSKAGCEEQFKLVTNLTDGHSGNSFGMAVRLAYHYVSDPELVWMEHGAMCPLTGCKDYGCNVISHIDNDNYGKAI